MKVLLLNSPWVNNEEMYSVKSGTRWAALRRKDSSMPYYPFPYFLASATAVLKKEGFDAHIKDAIAEELSREECMAYVENLKPGLLVIDAFTPSIDADLSFMQEAKAKTACYSVFCGAHSTALPADMLKNSFMDFVLLGEYDYTLRELVDFLSRGRSDFEKISGLAYKKNGSVLINSRRPQIENLDDLPFPERDELPMHKYNEPFSKNYPNARVTSSRGCPYNCIFCTEPLMYEKASCKKRSVSLVLEEIKMLSDKYGAREISFDDPIFTISRAKEIAEAILRDNLKISWSSWMDWNISFDDLKLLQKSGCVGIKFGVESANPEVLKTAKKPLHISKIRELIKNCRRLGLLRHASFMFGLPGDTVKNMRDTIDLAFSLDLTSCQLAIATPLPGTPFYKMAEEKGWLVTKDWSQYEPHYTAVVEYPGCRKIDIEAAISLARQKKVEQVLRNPMVALSYLIKLYRLKGAKDFSKEVFQKTIFAFRALSRRYKTARPFKAAPACRQGRDGVGRDSALQRQEPNEPQAKSRGAPISKK